MSQDKNLKYLIAYIFGFLVQYMMRIDGLVIGGKNVLEYFMKVIERWDDV